MFCYRTFLLVLIFAVTAGTGAQSAAEFDPYAVYTTGGEAQTVVVGDLDGDGRDDVAVAVWPSELYVYYQQVDGTLGPPTSLYAPLMPLGIAIGDVDGDGRGDLVVGDSNGRIHIYYQQENGDLGLPYILYTYGCTSGILIADLNSDGLADIATCTSNYPALFVLLQDPMGGFGLPSVIPLDGTNARSIAALDYNFDGRTDLAVLLDDGPCYILQSAVGAFEAPQYLTAVWAYSLAAGDVTGDCLEDLVVTIAMHQPDAALVVYAQGSSGPEPPMTYPAYDYPGPLVLADLDGDGRLDAATAHRGYETLTVFRQFGGGFLNDWEDCGIRNSSYYQPGAIAAGDLNSNGKVDIAIADPWNGLVVLLGVQDAANDVVPPACFINILGTLGADGWYVSPGSIELSATENDGGSGVSALYYTLDGQNWLPYSFPVAVESQGITTLGVYAEDLAGNSSETDWVEIKIDTEAPVLDLTPSVSTLWPPNGKLVEVPISVTASDETSGLASLRLCVIDEYGLVEPEMDVSSSTVTVSLVASRNEDDEDGRVYTLVLTGTDAAGNAASASAMVVVPRSNSKKPVKPVR